MRRPFNNHYLRGVVFKADKKMYRVGGVATENGVLYVDVWTITNLGIPKDKQALTFPVDHNRQRRYPTTRDLRQLLNPKDPT